MNTESPILILTGIGSELIPDAGIAESRAIASADDLLRRSYVRAVFALVEGLNFARLHVSTQPGHLVEAVLQKADVAVRVERRAVKDNDDGGIAASTRVSFAAFAAAHAIPNPLTPSGERWQAFLDAVAIRNRLTHPRSGADCRVSERDFELVRRAHHWYQELDSQLLQAAVGHGEPGA